MKKNEKCQIEIFFWTRIVLSVIISGWVKYDDSWRRRVMLRMNFLWIKTWREDREYDRKPETRNRRLEIGKTWNWRKSSGNDFKNFYSTLVLLFPPKIFYGNFRHFFWKKKKKLENSFFQLVWKIIITWPELYICDAYLLLRSLPLPLLITRTEVGI